MSEYDINKETNINYLFDYSEYLIKEKMFDEKIANWQVENIKLLKPLGLDTNQLKKVSIIKY
jgi:hypothetical protein